ncbi:hypothetical protein [Streptomyces xiamenensis]|uniref:hypothetical protein n=1 Tax=Streptomyces xiamenensis TaxID=408015 RepID=UPI0035E0F823
MDTDFAPRKARKRDPKVRSRKTNNRPALLISTLPPQHVQLAPDTLIVCPTCTTWVPVRRDARGNSTLVPHDTGHANIDDRHPCTTGSNRQVTINLTPRELQERHREAAATTHHRRQNRVTPKPRAPKPPAITQMQPVAAPTSPEQRRHRAAMDDLAAHRLTCTTCKTAGTCRTDSQYVLDADRAQAVLTAHRTACDACQDAAPCHHRTHHEKAIAAARQRVAAHRANCHACQATSHCHPGSQLLVAAYRAQQTYAAARTV